MPNKILIVDDEPDLELLINMNFKREIRAGQYQFVYALNGAEALDKLEANGDVDVVLTDINMPQMDGLTLLARLNEQYPVLRTVIVSAYGDMSNIRTALNRGAFDFVTKPIDLQDLGITLTKAIKEAEDRKQALQNQENLLHIQNELGVASRIQSSILPRTFPPFPDRTEIDISAAIFPAREVGGDFYDFFFLDAHRLGIVIGDVSGKGVPAALFMAVSRTFLKATALTGLPPADCLAQINRTLYKESVAGMFVTLIYAIFDTRNGELIYSNGGHNLPLVLRSDGTVEALDRVEGIAIAASGKARFSEGRVQLQRGDVLVLYTDGISEAFNLKNEEFGEERLATSLRNMVGGSAKELTDGLIAEVNGFADGAQQSDDLTVLVLRYVDWED